MSFRSNRTFTRFTFAAMLGIAVVVGCAGTTVYAADDDQENELLDTKVVRGFLKALGLRREGDDDINYRERSPLVLPANKSLPPPETVNPAAKQAGWPDDPDVKAQKRRKTAEKNRKAYVEGVDDRPLLPSQYSPQGAAPRPKPEVGSSGSFEAAARPSTQAELGAKSIFSNMFAPKEEYKTFSSEPPRVSLTDPPAGYRTPSPNQPYGVGQEKWKPPVIDRQEAPR
jgi:hypothetical protein